MINNKPVSCRFKLISVHSTILFFKYHQLGLEGLGQFSKPEAVGCILTVFKFSLYLVHCRFQHFYYFICNCVCYSINIRFNTSLIHILQSVAASRQGGRHLPPNIFCAPPIFFCSLICPLEYLAAPKLFVLVCCMIDH